MIEFQVSDVVTLKLGGLKMTVTEVVPKPDGRVSVQCFHSHTAD